MENGLQVLLAKEAIVDMLNRLFLGIDTQNWGMVQSCFAASVHVDMTSLFGGASHTRTSKQITAAWSDDLRHIEAVHHQASNYRVSVHAASALAACYATISHYRRVQSGHHTRTWVGTYDFHLVQAGEGWRIDQLTFHLKYQTGNPYLDREPPSQQ